jgi:hypothetical protein
MERRKPLPVRERGRRDGEVLAGTDGDGLYRVALP